MVQFHEMELNLVTLPCQQGGSEVMISSWTGFNHGQILIETATHSLSNKALFLSNFVKDGL